MTTKFIFVLLSLLVVTCNADITPETIRSVSTDRPISDMLIQFGKQAAQTGTKQANAAFQAVKTIDVLAPFRPNDENLFSQDNKVLERPEMPEIFDAAPAFSDGQHKEVPVIEPHNDVKHTETGNFDEVSHQEDNDEPEKEPEADNSEASDFTDGGHDRVLLQEQKQATKTNLKTPPAVSYWSFKRFRERFSTLLHLLNPLAWRNTVYETITYFCLVFLTGILVRPHLRKIVETLGFLIFLIPNGIKYIYFVFKGYSKVVRADAAEQAKKATDAMSAQFKPKKRRLVSASFESGGRPSKQRNPYNFFEW